MKFNMKFPEYPNTRAFALSNKEIVPIYVLSHPAKNKVTLIFDVYNGKGASLSRVGTVSYYNGGAFATFRIDNEDLVMNLNNGDIMRT